MAGPRNKRDKLYNQKETLGDAMYKFISAKVMFDEGIYSRYYGWTINSNDFMGRLCILLGRVPQYDHNVPVPGVKTLDKAYGDEFEVMFYEVYLDGGMAAAEMFFRKHVLPYLQMPGGLINFMREPLIKIGV